MAEQHRPVSEQIKAYVDAKADEIDGRAFVRITFDVHHGRLRRARVERTDEFGGDGESDETGPP